MLHILHLLNARHSTHSASAAMYSGLSEKEWLLIQFSFELDLISMLFPVAATNFAVTDSDCPLWADYWITLLSTISMLLHFFPTRLHFCCQSCPHLMCKDLNFIVAEGLEVFVEIHLIIFVFNQGSI